MSRLKREGNPPSGQLASPVPQAWDPVIEDYARITGQNLGNSRFGADSLQWGKTSDGLYVPIKVDSEGRQEVTLSGTIDTVNYFANINDLSSSSELYFSDLIIGRAPYIQLSFRLNKSAWKTVQISFHTHTGDPITDTSFIQLPAGGYIYGTGSQQSGITKDIPLLSPYYKIGVRAAGASNVRMSSMAIVYKDSPTNPLDWLPEEGE